MDWRLERTVATTETVVSVQEVKDQLRVDHISDDTLIDRYIDSAIDEIEGPYGIGVMLGEQTWKMYLDGFYYLFQIPLFPVKSVDSIAYVDTNGDQQTLADDQYRVDTVSNPARIVPEYNISWPATRSGEPNAVEIEFTGGFDKVPADLKQAVILIATHRYTMRQPVVVGTTAARVPMTVESILSKYRVPGFG